MPDRHYYTPEYPPTARDHFYAHYGTVFAAGWAIVFALLLIFAYFIPGYAGYIDNIDQPSLQALRIGQGLILIAGNILILKGVFVNLSKRESQLMNQYWRFLSLGFILAGAGWLSHILLILALSPFSLVGLSIAVAQFGFCLVGYIVTRKIKANMEKVVEKYRRVREELR